MLEASEEIDKRGGIAWLKWSIQGRSLNAM